MLKQPKKEVGSKIGTPASEDQRSSEQRPPTFSLEYLQGDYCLSKCDKENKAAFADTLHKLSQLTWSQIKSSSRHGAGTEKIKQDAIKTSLPPHVTPEVTLLAFRYMARAPMVGYRDGHTFNVLFLDRDFTLYKHS